MLSCHMALCLRSPSAYPLTRLHARFSRSSPPLHQPTPTSASTLPVHRIADHGERHGPAARVGRSADGPSRLQVLGLCRREHLCQLALVGERRYDVGLHVGDVHHQAVPRLGRGAQDRRGTHPLAQLVHCLIRRHHPDRRSRSGGNERRRGLTQRSRAQAARRVPHSSARQHHRIHPPPIPLRLRSHKNSSPPS